MTRVLLDFIETVTWSNSFARQMRRNPLPDVGREQYAAKRRLSSQLPNAIFLIERLYRIAETAQKAVDDAGRKLKLLRGQPAGTNQTCVRINIDSVLQLQQLPRIAFV